MGVSIKEVVEGIALDQGALLPVSARQSGALGISGVCLSLPTQVGRNGVRSILEPKVSDSEREGLQKSAESLKAVLAQLA